ncbi:SusD/RagB family nutrient-binding outer membrane lipoprotein [Pedobacter sp. NJ-S-72]
MKKIYIILVAAALFSSCAKNMGDYNVDQKKATAVPGVMFVSNAEKNFTDILTTPNVNSNVFRFFYVQYWTSTEYLDEPRYNLTARAIPAALWDAVYQKVIVNLREGKKLIEADALLNADIKANQVAQAEILEVMAWSTLVNAFGNVLIASQAMDINIVNPKYDDAATVYNDLLVRLDAALAKLKPAAGGLGTADIIYKGDINAWVKFGNSLKLRLGLIIADKDPAKAKTVIESAAANVFKSAADNAVFKYLGSSPNNNPISTNANSLLTKRQDYVGAKPFIDRLNVLQDPRRKGFFTTIGGNFVGGNYGGLSLTLWELLYDD